MTPLLAHALAVFIMTGVAWILQLVLYPGFTDVEKRQWPGYHKRYTRRITCLALPLMIADLCISGWLVWTALHPLHLIFFACSLFIWILTAIVFLPLQQELVFRPTARHFAKLSRLNWIRTLTWTTCAAASAYSLL